MGVLSQLAFVLLVPACGLFYLQQTDPERYGAVLRSLVRWFGPEARTRLRDFVSCTWARDPWSRGCPVNLLPARHCSRVVHASRASLFDGRVPPASTEAAPDGPGGITTKRAPSSTSSASPPQANGPRKATKNKMKMGLSVEKNSMQISWH